MRLDCSLSWFKGEIMLPQCGMWHQCLLPLHMSVLAGERVPDPGLYRLLESWTELGWRADARTTMISVVHICSDCKYLGLCHYLFIRIEYSTSAVISMISQKCHWRWKSMLCTSYFPFLCNSDDCVVLMGAWFYQLLQSLTLKVYTERNVQVSVYRSWPKEMVIHQYTSFLETGLLPLLHRSALPVASLLSPIRSSLKMDDDIAFQGWVLPVQHTSLL